jgi:ABC-type multidrug transport system fused ATPase/permease subunit
MVMGPESHHPTTESAPRLGSDEADRLHLPPADSTGRVAESTNNSVHPQEVREKRIRPRNRRTRNPEQVACAQARQLEDQAREAETTTFIHTTTRDRSPSSDYLRSVKEIWNISPRTWITRIGYTTAGAVCAAGSMFAFSQTLALVGDAEMHPILGAPIAAIGQVLGWLAGSLAFWYMAGAAQTRTDIIAAKHANEVDVTIDRSIRALTGSLPEEARQREDVSELLGLVEHHEKSSKELVTGIISLSQELVELVVTAGTVIVSGAGLGIIPVAMGGYLKYRGASRCAAREVESEEAANQIDLFYQDGDRALTTNSSISNLQLTHAFDTVADKVVALKKESASIRFEAFQKNERDGWLVERILEIPVAGSCAVFLSQWMAGELSSATCIWLMLSIWSVRSNINTIGTLFSSQVTDLKLASYRHALIDIVSRLGDRREQVFVDAPSGVTFDKVRLRRRGSSRDTLKETSFAIQPGMSVAVVGNNGQGKSSLLGLIAGRILPSSGSVLIGSHNTREKAVFSGNLTQDYTLLAGHTVRENIELYRPPVGGMNAEQVVDLLGIRELLCENKPEGLDTVIPGRSQKGTNFSGGQRQLIALAQAVASESGMLLLDEPLSALGPSMQSKINTVLLSLERKPTIFLVTHKYEQAHSCDWVLVVEKGEIVEQGNPVELLGKARGKYRSLYGAQRKLIRGQAESEKRPPAVDASTPSSDDSSASEQRGDGNLSAKPI